MRQFLPEAKDFRVSLPLERIMNILVDFHHSDLWWSHHQTLVEILGHKLYMPRGMDWFHEGFSQIDDNKSEELAKQMLVGSFIPYENNTRFISYETLNKCPYYPDFNVLSLDEAKETPIDAFLITLISNEQPIKRFRDKYHPNAKLVRQVGNPEWIRHIENSCCSNIMFSVLELFKESTCPNKVFYHQKFDTDRIFTFSEIDDFRLVTSFLSTFRQHPELVEFMEKHLNLLPGIEFADYGITERCGHLHTKGKLAAKMREGSFVWHVKNWDGYGHILHNAFAMGRPLITRAGDYENTTGGMLIEDNVTCIVLDRNDINKNTNRLLDYFNNPIRIREMSVAAHKRFFEVVNWQREADEIQVFLDNLL